MKTPSKPVEHVSSDLMTPPRQSTYSSPRSRKRKASPSSKQVVTMLFYMCLNHIAQSLKLAVLKYVVMEKPTIYIYIPLIYNGYCLTELVERRAGKTLIIIIMINLVQLEINLQLISGFNLENAACNSRHSNDHQAFVTLNIQYNTRVLVFYESFCYFVIKLFFMQQHWMTFIVNCNEYQAS